MNRAVSTPLLAIYAALSCLPCLALDERLVGSWRATINGPQSTVVLEWFLEPTGNYRLSFPGTTLPDDSGQFSASNGNWSRTGKSGGDTGWYVFKSADEFVDAGAAGKGAPTLWVRTVPAPTRAISTSEHHNAAAVDSVAHGQGPIHRASPGFPGIGDYHAWVQANVYYNEGQAFFRQAQYGQAIDKYRMAINVYAYDPDYDWNLACLLNNRGNYTEAETVFSNYTKLMPHDWNGWYMMGRVLSKEHKWSAAREAFQLTLKYNPPSADQDDVQRCIQIIESKIQSTGTIDQ